MSYSVFSKQTNYYIVSNGSERPGDRVVTVPGSERDPDTTVVNIFPRLEKNTLAYVQGQTGLYVSVERDDENQYLVWSNDAYQWHFAANGPPGTLSVHIPDIDLYWYDKFNVGIGRHIILKPGRAAMEQEIYFVFEQA